MKRVVEAVNERLERVRRRHTLELEERRREIARKIPQITEVEAQLRKNGYELVRTAVGNRGVLPELRKRGEQLQIKRKALLREHGYPEDYLEMAYDCQICRDTGVVETRICDCKQRLVASELYSMSGIEYAIQRENFQTFDLKRFRANRNQGETISPREAMGHYLADAQKYVRDFDGGAAKNLLYNGPVGTGKTFLCNCIAKELLDQGKVVIYQTSPKLMSFLADYRFSKPEDKRELATKVELLQEADLLVLDDLGTEPVNSVTISNLFELLNDRILSGKGTIISTNLELEEIASVYDRRIFSRILGEFKIYRIFGDDLRMKKFGL
ncbi:MAG: ATP-binding protein [Tissierellia bacterium]|nr:ATP-binding protein [Tissierellia bacterium]